MKIYLIKISIITILFTACRQNADTLPDAGKPETKETPEAQLIPFTRKQFRSIGIVLGTFSQRNLKTTIKANGVLELPPQNIADVTSFTSGNITRILVTQGEAVKKGQALAYITHPDIISLQEEYLQERQQFIYEEKEFNRQKELSGQDVSAAKTFQKTEADYQMLKAKLYALQAKLALLHLSAEKTAAGLISKEAPVVAPIDGYVAGIKVNTGSSVSGSAALFEITDNSHIHADLLVYEKDIYKIHEGQKVQFTLTNLPGEIFTADVFAVGKSFEKDIKAVKVHARINNPNGRLLPGTYIDARILLDNSSVPALPDEAVVREGEHNHIFILHENTADAANCYFEKVEVKKGASDAGFTEVFPFKDLPADARIVLKGAYYISAQSMNKKEE